MKNTSILVKSAILAVISFIIMQFELVLPFFPSFLKLDLSDIPAVLAGFAIGPLSGVMVALVKNLLHLFQTSTGGIGEIANFLIAISFVLPASMIYRNKKNRKSAHLSLITGTVLMSFFGGAVNYFFLLPFYSTIMPIDVIIELGSKVNPIINSILSLVFYAIMPFNILKGTVISLITLSIYKRISPMLR